MKISEEKINTIKTNILALLYEKSPQALFTTEISRIEARDEEFVKSIMMDLKSKGLVVAIKKNPKGQFYSRRIRWRLSNKAYEAYKKIS